MNDNEDVTPEELAEAVQLALGELLNIASGVAELQTTDEAADDIYVICDLIAEFFEIERAVVTTEELPDGTGYITRLEKPAAANSNKKPIRGSIRNKPKYTISDQTPKPKRPDE